MKVIITLLFLFVPIVASSQENPLSTHSKVTYGGIKQILLRAAESMPKEYYDFKPAESVRTYGQIVGHVADSNYMFCSQVLNQKNPAPEIEKNKKSKTELIAALKEAFVYCDQAYDDLTDASGAEMQLQYGRKTPKLGTLAINQIHSIEHYGNLVTYMRMKDVVPPTSDPEFMRQLSR